MHVAIQLIILHATMTRVLRILVSRFAHDKVLSLSSLIFSVGFYRISFLPKLTGPAPLTMSFF